MSYPEPSPGASAPPTGWAEPPPGTPPLPPGPPPPRPPPPVAPPPPTWVPPPPPRKSRTGLVIGLVVGGVVLFLLLAIGTFLAARSYDETDVRNDTTDDAVATTLVQPSTTTGGPTTSVAGTAGPSAVNAANAASFLRDEQQKVTPGIVIGAISCPPAPYRIGHVVVCRMELGDATVLYRVEVTGEDTLRMEPLTPIVDTDEAEALMEEKEPGSTADCGEPRVRQLQAGDRITCRTERYTWDFTVGPDGNLTGTTR